MKSALTNWLEEHPEIAFDERLKTLRELGNEHEDLEWYLASRDVSAILREGRDLRFEFERGRIGAQEVLAEIQKKLPGLAGSADEGLRVRLFRHLAETDYARAVKLLDDLPEERRENVI